MFRICVELFYDRLSTLLCIGFYKFFFTLSEKNYSPIEPGLGLSLAAEHLINCSFEKQCILVNIF